MIRVACGALLLACVCGCAGPIADLDRATIHYEEARYESVLVWLSELESELPRMTPAERSKFLYLRGMSAYRLGQRDDAVHYLALARESVALQPESLSQSLRSTLERAIVVLAAGTTSATESLGAR